MALTRLFFATSLLLLSSQALVSAVDDGYGTNYYAPNAEQENNNPKHLHQFEPKDYTDPVPEPNPDQIKPKDYTHRVPKPDLNNNPEPDQGYLPKPQPDGYIPDPKSALDKLPKPKLDKPEYVVPKQGLEKPIPICIEGLVLCKRGSKFTPIKGALARITCLGEDETGYDKSLSILSPATDEKGFFFATLTSTPKPFHSLTLTECRAYLENSPSESTCKVPTDINDGMSGALLDAYRILKEKHIKLYRVKPFVFTPESAPGGY